MSPAHREMATSLLDSTYAQFVSGIAEDRGLSEDFVRQTVDMAPVTTAELEGMGLLDGTAPFPEAVRSLGDGPVIKGSDYAQVGFESVGFEPVVDSKEPPAGDPARDRLGSECSRRLKLTRRGASTAA